MRMKKKQKPIMNVVKEKPDTTFKYEISLKAENIIDLAIEKIGPKRVLNIIFGQCLMNTLEKTTFPMSVFANKEDEEKADVTAALYYLRKNWKASADKGIKMLQKIKAEQK